MDNLHSWIDKLNKEQKEAVLENSNPLLVLAGAGSGKTRVITTKIAYCIQELGINPWNILAVTFTNKAAKEMKDRVVEMLPSVDPTSFNIRTFHSFGVWLLRRFTQEANLANSFTIYDDNDSLSLLKSIYPGIPKNELVSVRKKISRAKDMGLSIDDDLNIISGDPFFKKAFIEYETSLRNVGNVDFADLISIPNKLLNTNSDVLNFVRRRFKVILVDEYQDSNIAQFNLLHSLVDRDTFICVVGDDDQSIYKFRGAEVKNILSFPEIFPNSKTITLNQNYRSTASILEVASSVISKNKARHQKQLFTQNFQGEKPTVYYVSDEEEEARSVINLIKRRKNYNNSAILYRTNAQSQPFESLLNRNNIPYRIIGALKFYEREEVKDALALMQLFLNSKDVVNFRRMINKPPRAIGKASVGKIEAFLSQSGGDVFDAIDQACKNKVLSPRCSKNAQQFISDMQKAFNLIVEGQLSLGVKTLLEDTGLIDYYKKQDSTNNTFKVENLNTLINALESYPSNIEGLQQFLEEACLDRTKLGLDEKPEEGVVLITMHNTKGLEFEDVYVVGLEEGLFPSSMSIEEDPNGEEERRLFYVSTTRAKNRLSYYCASSRRIWGRVEFNRTPSRFLDEIEPGLVTEVGQKPIKFEEDFDIFSNSALSLRRKQNKPRSSSFSSFKTDTSNLIHQGFSPSSKKFKFEKEEENNEKSESRFSVGDRVFNEEKGRGWVVECTSKNSRELIKVKYDSGKEAKYISKYAKLEKLYDEL
jgi:DNA helicase-2/ATP-dependent DNA helicase PcrA